jgi:YVTN family beta-propeller protein
VTNTVTDTFVVSLPPPPGQTLSQVAVDPTNHTIYLAAPGLGLVLIYDEFTHTLLEPLLLGGKPVGFAFDPVLDVVYVSQATGGTVTVLDGATHAVVATVSVGTFPVAMACDPGTHTVFVVIDENAVVVMDGTTNTVTETIPDDASPRDVAVDPVNHAAFVAGAGDQLWKLTPGCTGPLCAIQKITLLGAVVARAHVGHGLALSLLVAEVAETLHDQPAACCAMNAFSAEVDAGASSFLTAAEVASWSEQAISIEDAMSCSSP